MASKILVIDDNSDTRELLHLYFTRAGFDVITAVDGRDGLDRTQAAQPDLIITDLTMPNMDGIEMMKHLRSDPQTADIPVIVITAYGSASRDQLAEARVERVVYKPFDFEGLIQIIREALGR